MCGRYRLDLDWTEIVRLYRLDPDDSLDFVPRYNVAPTDRMPVIGLRDGRRAARAMRWGLLTPWAKTLGEGAKCINARAETAASSPAFKDAMARRRVLVPSTGFYEWRRGPGKEKTPFWIRPVAGKVLTFAGLWSPWRHPDTGEVVPSFAVLTCAPNRLMASIHDRMPVVLSEADADRWLAPGGADAELLAPAPEGVLEAVEVNPAVGSVRNDTEDATRPVEGAGLTDQRSRGTPDRGP